MDTRITVDKNAPIVPGISLGGINLRITLKDCYDLVKSFSWIDKKTYRNASVSLYSDFHIGYELQDTLVLVFHAMNGKLMKIIAKKNYNGAYKSVTVGMSISKARQIVKEFEYDEDEEYYYIKGVKGIVFDADACDEYIEAISVHIKELDEYQGDFSKWKELERGNW